MAESTTSGKVTRMSASDVHIRKVPNWLLELAKKSSGKKFK